MKTIGLLGGMSWESSIEYYRIINQLVNKKLGGVHSAKILMYSVDFAEIEKLQHQERWEEATNFMIDAAKRIEQGGADFLVICTNTMHKMADDVQKAINIPLLHIADATAQRIKEQGIKRVGLLGTKFTMEEDFYRDRLNKLHGLEVLIPQEKDRNIVHRIIYEELVRGIIKEKSKKEYIRIIEELVKNKAEGIILGCTEIGLLVKNGDVPVPLFDTTFIHAEAAVKEALN